MNMRRIWEPSCLRTGIFCRFGSVEDRRPVAVTVIWKLVWILPSGEMTFKSPSA